MKKNSFFVLALFIAATMMALSCQTSRKTVTVSMQQVVIDKSYDSMIDPSLTAFLAPYKQNVDSLMSPVVGQTARVLNAGQPESPLSNMLCDMLVWVADSMYGQKVDFAVYNMGGIRASFPAGNVTKGDVLDVAPFNNKPCFFMLSAASVDSLFQEMAAAGGEGVSREVRLVITPEGKLLSAKVDGRTVGSKQEYRVATIDYLAQGNDKMIAFKNKYNVTQPNEEKDNMRNVIEQYFRAMSARGIKVDGQMDGRITVEK